MQHRNHLLIAAFLLNVAAFNAQASLSSTDGGLGVYDSAGNITWTSDANLLGTLEAGNAGLIATIVSDEASVISSNYAYTLSSSDFGTGANAGQVSWWGAHAYVDYLNTIDYGNSNQWALPTSGTTCAGPNCTNSQLGELFYTELGGSAGSPIPTNSLFTNEQSSTGYWSGTQDVTYPASLAWSLYTYNGAQYTTGKYGPLYAWAVSPGEIVTALPEPDVLWLMLTGLGVLGLKRRGTVN